MLMRLGAGLAAVLASLMLAGTAATAHDVKAGDLTIRHPWARATPGGAQVAGAYAVIVNTGTAPDRLLGGSIDAATTFELHRMASEGGVMTMRPTGPLEIPAGGSLTLEPSGQHIMVSGLKRGLKQGEAIAGTLVFEHAGTVAVRFEVEAVGAKAPAGDGTPGHAGHSMPGMDMD